MSAFCVALNHRQLFRNFRRQRIVCICHKSTDL